MNNEIRLYMILLILLSFYFCYVKCNKLSCHVGQVVKITRDHAAVSLSAHQCSQWSLWAVKAFKRGVYLKEINVLFLFVERKTKRVTMEVRMCWVFHHSVSVDVALLSWLINSQWSTNLSTLVKLHCVWTFEPSAQCISELDKDKNWLWQRVHWTSQIKLTCVTAVEHCPSGRDHFVCAAS